MESSGKKIAINAVLNTVKTVVGILFPLITFPYILRVLGVENNGIYTFSRDFASYFQLFAALGISTYAVREGPQYRNDRDKITRFSSEMFTINLISTFIAYVALFAVLLVVPKLADYRVIIAILSLEMIFTTVGASWICNIFEDFYFIAIRSIIMQVISLALVFILVRDEGDLINYAFILLLANSGANLMNFFYVRKKYCAFKVTSQIDWKSHLKPILVIFSTTVAITIYVSLDTTMLGFMLNDYEVGLYGTAVSIYKIIKTVLAAVLVVFIPRFSLLMAEGKREELNKMFTKVFNVLSLLMLPMVVGLFMMSDEIVLLAGGSEEYAGSAPSLRILSLGIIFSLFSFIFTQCILIPAKKENCVFIATAISAVVNVVLNLILIPLWGIEAAAVTTVLAEFITFCVSFAEARKHVSVVNAWRESISVVLGCIIIVVVCLLCRKIEPYYLRLIVAIAGSCAGYFVVLLLAKNSSLKELVNMVVSRGKKKDA